MRIFISIDFNGQQDELKSHITLEIKSILAEGHSCIVMCQHSSFSETLKKMQVEVLETNYGDSDHCIDIATNFGPFDLVHTHPFLSRVVGCGVAKNLSIPLLLSIHGMYVDSIDEYKELVDFVLTANKTVSEYFLKNSRYPEEKVFTSINDVGISSFYKDQVDSILLSKNFPDFDIDNIHSTTRRILLVTKMDEEEKFTLDIVIETWKELLSTRSFDIQWIISGDGALRNQMEDAADEVNKEAGRPIISFVGRLNRDFLSTLYKQCHLSIASGKAVLEAMTYKIPCLAIGSKSYIGLIEKKNALTAINTDFNGIRGKHIEYLAGEMFNDIDNVIYDDKKLLELANVSEMVIRNFFAQSDIYLKSISIYELSIFLSTQKPKYDSLKSVLAFPALDFKAHEIDSQMALPWSVIGQAENISACVKKNNTLSVTSSLGNNENAYIVSSTGPFSSPPINPGNFSLSGNTLFSIRARLEVLCGKPNIQLLVIEYSKVERIRHTKFMLNSSVGANTTEFLTSPETVSFKVAFRISGQGSFSVDGLQLFRKVAENAERITSFNIDQSLRYLENASYQEYQGENLVFIVGAPRSGTTWMLNLLEEHPDIIRASVENLDVKINNNKTLETNIFNKNRPFTDKQIKYKFYTLSQKNSNKILVEKTPIHLLFVDRIKRIFPKSSIVLMLRDGRDVVTSIAKVGQDADSWWKGAPDNVENATLLWIKYAKEAIRCINDHNPSVVKYEKLLTDTHSVLENLLSNHGMSAAHVSRQINASEAGKNIPIEGVYREGKSGGWSSFFTHKDEKIFNEIAEKVSKELGY